MHIHDEVDRPVTSKVLVLSLILTLLFAVVEAVSGWWSHSLSLIGDAGHMVSDSFALGLAAAAIWLVRQPPSARHSYGFGRTEVIAALTNSLIMLAIVVWIFMEAVARIQSPEQVIGSAVMIVAGIGLLVNVVIAVALHRGEQTLNVRAALLHVMGDILGSIAALVSGVVIYLSGWLMIDPILSIFICILILISSVRLLREAMRVLMEGVPLHIDLPEVGTAIAGEDKNVISVHDLHIWSLSSGVIALSAHVVVKDLSEWDKLLTHIREMLDERFGIKHVTLQPETSTHVIQPMAYRSAERK